MSEPVESASAKPVSRLRKWGIRILKTLAVLAVLFAAFHLEENWRGSRAYRRALADWKAAGFPTADEYFKNPPPVPDDRNLLAGPFFSAWRVTTKERDKYRDSDDRWTAMRRVAFVKADDGSEKAVLTKLFEPDGKKKPLLEHVAGQSDAQAVMAAVEKDFPDIVRVPKAVAARPEVAFGYGWMPPEKAYEMEVPSFAHVRATSAALTLYAEAKLAEGNASYALAGAHAMLRYVRNPENKTLVGVMIGSVQFGSVVIPLLTTASRPGHGMIGRSPDSMSRCAITGRSPC